MELLELFLQPEQVHIFKDIKTVLSIMVRAALMSSLESIMESWISTMEDHSFQRRTTEEMLLLKEMVIAYNGPKLVYIESNCQ